MELLTFHFIVARILFRRTCICSDYPSCIRYCYIVWRKRGTFVGKKNTITKDYMSVPEHFADCYNYFLFDGEQVIKAANLKPLDPTEIAIIPEDATGETVEKIRDLLKQCILMHDDKANYLLLGILNSVNNFIPYIGSIITNVIAISANNTQTSFFLINSIIFFITVLKF